MNNEMPTRYDAIATEPKWYAAWENAGLFSPDSNPNKPRYTIAIPPPNITGSLHMGHALCYPIQDMLGRYRRLRGDSVLILPGQDHAGIATQSVVDKMLRKEGLSAAQLGREKFVERVWEWRKESGDTILKQFRALGCAFDWSRTRFTLDDDYASAVLQVFIDWFERGLIYRGKRVVNWDPKLKTSVSDIETVREMVKGKLYHIRYPFTDGSGEVVIATTRPETMLADVAVAVHPSDKRYEGKVGKTLRLPLVGREIPLIADMYPDPEFGTGAVKITPAHDANDYQVGVRHSLDMPVILDQDARVDFPELDWVHGLDRKEARIAVVERLEAEGYLVEVEDHDIAILISDRSKDVIEPLLSEQWFVDQAALAKPVLEAQARGEFDFTPSRYDRIFQDWMENIREWCISRQLWWGHRIPVYYTEDGTAIAAQSWEAAQAKSDKPIVRQDDDVLDTWFSSGLWPFATLGWPDQTADLEQFYPNTVLVTDRNIINLWVARMLMMGYDLMGTKPFSDIMIYATVLNEKGQRMSKSLGTGVDPMTVIETTGADSLRWTLLSQTGDNQDLRYSEKKVEEGRNFGNKIWNASRFVLMNVDSMPVRPAELSDVDRWLLSRLARTERTVREAYDQFDLMSGCQALYRFFWNEVCDWYIEVSKPRLNDPTQRETPQWVLLTAFDAFLRMLHPVMPFLTEELYSHLPLPDKAPFLMAASWPTIDESLVDEATEARIERQFEIVRSMRALRASIDVAAMSQVPLVYVEGDLQGGEAILKSQAWVGEVRSGRPTEKHISVTVEGLDLHLPVEGLIDPEKERARIERERDKAAKELAGLEGRLNNPHFVERAKPEIIERDRAAAVELKDKLAKLEERFALLD